ncbi:MAG: DNA polymerase II [archaeon]
MKGFIVCPAYREMDGKAQVMLYGRLETGESFVTINDFEPYFWIARSDKKKASAIAGKARIEDSDFRNFQGKPVSRVVVELPKQVPELRKEFLEQNIPCYEADIRFPYRFMMDRGLLGCMGISGESNRVEGLNVDRVYENPVLTPADYTPTLKVLSVDIETDPLAKQIYSVSLYSDSVSKVLLRKEGQFRNAECFSTEKRLLESFCENIIDIDPDIIIGWNFIDFDLAVLKRQFAKHKVPFKFGRSDEECKLRISDSFFRDSSANVPGRAVIDGIHLMKISFVRLDDYKLNTAAKTILGEEKLITSKNRAKEIDDLYKRNPQKLVDYNLKDSELVYRLVEKSGTLGLSVKRSMLTGMPVDRVNASIASLDSLYLRELQMVKTVAPSVVSTERGERIKGGFVMASKPGVYTGVIVLDFKSLYPSIIRTFNIDPYSYVPKKEPNTIEAPNKARFRNEDGILPRILERLWKQRDMAKNAQDQFTSTAIKITMNSFFGVLANPSCRFYSVDIANAITHFGQYLNKLTAEKVKEKGYDVIYGDTDSIFVNTEEDINAASVIGRELQDYINEFFRLFIRKKFNRRSYLELEYEKYFMRFLMPRVRGSSEGAKKRYAGLVEKDGKESIVVTGLEFVRRDWTEIAKRFQMGLLEHIFHDKPVESYVRGFVDELRRGKMDNCLVYKKAIRKRVSEYTKTTPPHIKAARKLGKETPGIIEYLITVNGPEPVEKTSSAIDYEHYIEKQIRPIADSLLGFLDLRFDDMAASHRQTSLSSFGQ